MIQTQTLLKVSDNSGGKSVRCLKLLKKGNNPKIASVGDVIVVSVQNIRFKISKTLFFVIFYCYVLNRRE
mgnify:CR=1 FL=1